MPRSRLRLDTEVEAAIAGSKQQVQPAADTPSSWLTDSQTKRELVEMDMSDLPGMCPSGKASTTRASLAGSGG
jgi:hypothetical protein